MPRNSVNVLEVKQEFETPRLTDEFKQGVAFIQQKCAEVETAVSARFQKLEEERAQLAKDRKDFAHMVGKRLQQLAIDEFSVESRLKEAAQKESEVERKVMELKQRIDMMRGTTECFLASLD